MTFLWRQTVFFFFFIRMPIRVLSPFFFPSFLFQCSFMSLSIVSFYLIRVILMIDNHLNYQFFLSITKKCSTLIYRVNRYSFFASFCLFLLSVASCFKRSFINLVCSPFGNASIEYRKVEIVVDIVLYTPWSSNSSTNSSNRNEQKKKKERRMGKEHE